MNINILLIILVKFDIDVQQQQINILHDNTVYYANIFLI